MITRKVAKWGCMIFLAMSLVALWLSIELKSIIGIIISLILSSLYIIGLVIVYYDYKKYD